MKPEEQDEETLLRSTALQNSASILAARQRAEHELARVASTLRATFEATSDAILVLDDQGQVSLTNRRFLDLWGLAGRGIEGLRFPVLVELLAERCSAGRQLERMRAWASEQGHEVREELTLADGRIVEVSSSMATIDGRGFGSVWSFRDVTARRGAELAIRASERKVRATFEQAAVGMSLSAADGRLLQVNAKLSELLGYTCAELLRLTFFDVTHPDDVQLTRDFANRLLAGELRDASFEKRYVRKDGTVLRSLTTVAALRDERGGPAEFVAVIESIEDRKAAEDGLRESGQRLQLALAAGHLGDWSWDARTDLVELGPRAAEHFGLPVAPITWAALRARLVPEDQERARLAVETALRERTDYDIEYRVRRDGGEVVWIAAKGRGIFGKDGEVRGMIGVVQEVTRRKELELSHSRLVALVKRSDDAIVAKTLDGEITSWNDGAERMFGWKAEEILGRPVKTVIPAARHAEEDGILRRLRAGERLEHYETERLRRDGSVFPVSLTVSPMLDEAGRIVGAATITRDMTVRVRAEEALRDESRVLNLLNQAGKSIAADLDLETIVQSVTDSATKLSGAQFGAFFYNTTDASGNSYLLFTLSGAPRAAFEKFGQPRATPMFKPTFDGEDPIRLDDVTRDPRYGRVAPHFGMPAGHLPVRSYLAVPVKSRSGEVLGGLFFGHPRVGVFTARAEALVSGIAAQAAIAIDNARLYESVKRAANERKVLLDLERAARAEAERVNLLKDEFLATLSHELRTPLNAILGWAHVLRTQTQGQPELADGLAVIERNARLQTQLIEDLLDMSRIVSGKVRLDVQRVELQDVLQASVESVRPSAEAKGLRLRVVLDSEVGPVWGDPGRLQQCVWNLLSNAIKFTGKGGRVLVRLARVDSHAEVSVSDDGQGISEEFLPYVFERFRQADATTTRKHGGLGLGLSIVKSLIELHGGTVRAASSGKGQGATFTLELPLLAVDGRDDAPARAARQEASGGDFPLLEGLTVLVVDDEEDSRRLSGRVLEDCGARVVLAESANDGLEALQRERPHLVISDIGMPDVDGYGFIAAIRRLPSAEGGRTPAIALSAFARAEDRTRALRAGYQAHVAKPIDPAELAALVASLAAPP